MLVASNGQPPQINPFLPSSETVSRQSESIVPRTDTLQTPTLKLRNDVLKNTPNKKNGKHLILDLDETLVHSFDTPDGFTSFAQDFTDAEKERVYMIKFDSGDTLWGYVRPYAEEFLEVAFQEFESVGVWSAGTRPYVNQIVSIVFKDKKPKFVMSRDDCNEVRVKKEEIACRYKPLEIVYHRYPDHTEKNTVIVDDRHDVCALNCMNNIRIPEFQMNSRTYSLLVGDITLLTLSKWFRSDEFRNAQDVRLIKSRSPFAI